MIGAITWGWAIEAMIASTLLMAAVLVLRGPVRRAFGPDVAYALWALPVLRLILPPLPATWHAAALAPVQRATERVTVLLVAPLTGPVSAPLDAAAPSLAAIFVSELIAALAILWLVGAVAFVIWHAIAHRRFCARMLAETASSDMIGGVAVIETAAASGPLAFGIWRRYVAFPADTAERYDADERALALAHELGHHARGDLLANWVALAVLALHWFNPVAWRAFRAFRADQEIANDARVLAGLSPMRRHAYARAIVKTAQPAVFGAAVSTACHLHTIDDLKGRLKMLTTKRVSRTRLLTGAAAITLLIGGGLGLTASGTAAAAAARKSVEHATGVELASLDKAMPAMSAIPAMATMATMQAVPAAPAVPAVPAASPDAALPAPPAPPQSMTVTETSDGKHKTLRVIRSSETTSGEPAAAQDRKTMTRQRMVVSVPGESAGRIDVEVQNVPEVSESKCGIGSGKPNVITTEGKDHEKRKIIICTDRIEKMASDAAMTAANSKDIERSAYTHALAGLRGARARMMDSTDMVGEQRKLALESMDTAIREIEADLAKVN